MEPKEDTLATGVGLEDLPDEILAKVFHHLQFSDRLRMSVVCPRWNQLLLDVFGDRIKLFLSASTDYPVPIGKLSNRIYRNVEMFGTEQGSGWMEAIEDMAPELSSLDLYVAPVEKGSENRNPTSSFFDQLGEILKKLESLRNLLINTTPTTFEAISATIYELPNLNDLKVEIRIDDCSRFAMSKFNGLCRLPKLRALSICTYVPLYTSEKDYLVPAPFIESLTLELHSSSFNILKFYLLFPCLTTLDIRKVEIIHEDLEEIAIAWPALEVLVLGLHLPLLNSETLELLQQLNKLRKLELRTLTHFVDEDCEILNADYALLDGVLGIPNLQELHLTSGANEGIWWSGQIPDSRSCRLFVNGKFVPRSGLKDRRDDGRETLEESFD